MVRVRVRILAAGRTAAMEVEVDMLLREIGQHRGGDVSRLPQICADAGAAVVSRSGSVVAQS